MYRKIVIFHLLQDSQSFRTRALACQALLRNTKKKILAAKPPCHIPLQHPDRAPQTCPKLSTLSQNSLWRERGSRPRLRFLLRISNHIVCSWRGQNVADSSQHVMFPHFRLPLLPYEASCAQTIPADSCSMPWPMPSVPCIPPFPR